MVSHNYLHTHSSPESAVVVLVHLIHLWPNSRVIMTIMVAGDGGDEGCFHPEQLNPEWENGRQEGAAAAFNKICITSCAINGCSGSSSQFTRRSDPTTRTTTANLGNDDEEAQVIEQS